jgi:general stress protein 26
MTKGIIKTVCEFVRSKPASHLATVDGDRPALRVMYCSRIDENLTIWFATSAASNKVRQIKANHEVVVKFYDDGKLFKAIGTADVMEDQRSKDELWEEDWTRYWPAGKEDPDYCLLKIRPREASYLDMHVDPLKTHKLI